MNTNNQSGFTLIQVVVAATVMAFMMSSASSLFVSLFNENQALTQQVAVNELARSLSGAMGSSACGLMITEPGNILNASAMTFNPTNANFPISLNLDAIPLAGNIDVISNANPVASPITDSVRLNPNNGIQLQLTSPTTANVVIRFDQTRLKRQVRDLIFPIAIETTTAGSNVTVSGCGGTTVATAPPTAYVIDEKPSGTEAGNCVAGTWARRDLNTIRYDSGIGTTLSSNRVSLPPGTYRIETSAPASVSWVHQIRLRDVTNNVILGHGTVGNNASIYAHTTRSTLKARFVLGSTSDIAVEHWCQASHAIPNSGQGFFIANYSFGIPGPGNGAPEVYTTMEIVKED